MKKVIVLLILFLSAGYGFGQQTGKFTDARDGQVYKTVEIGEQTWMAENLNYETADSWWYNNDKANGDVYGRLYNWDAALKACPSGWHLPSDNEWKQLEMALGMSQSEADDTGFRGIDEGLKMKSKSGWNDNRNGTNSSGFSGLPGGSRGCNGSYHNLGKKVSWWSSEKCFAGMGTAWYRYLTHTNDYIYRGEEAREIGFSVRCLKE